ncbi:MAG: hypothetical protein IPP89_00450 [Saprospiraceae bacterium]|nr:hypothetical protein [Candidatus Brachybacter algidus]
MYWWSYYYGLFFYIAKPIRFNLEKTGFNTMTTLINGYITKQISSLSTGMVKARQPGTRSLG